MTTDLSQVSPFERQAMKLVEDIAKATAEVSPGVRVGPPVSDLLPGVRRGPISSPEAGDLLLKLNQATAVFGRARGRSEATGATQKDRALWKGAQETLGRCISRVNQLAAPRGGLPGLIGFLAEVAGRPDIPREITENDVAAVEVFVACALEVQEEKEQGQVADAAVGAGLGSLGLILVAAL